MNTIRNLLFTLIILLFTVPTVQAQDFSKYRSFSLGTSLSTVLKYTGQKMADVKVIRSQPALIQEVTWWPPNSPGTTFQSDAVREIVFSLYNGELYKMSVTYDRTSTEGLTTPDMMKLVTAKYGPIANVALAIDSPANDRYDLRAKTIASWEDSQYAIDLVRSAFTDDFGLIIYSKRVNADAELAIAEGVKLEEQERPRREAERRKRETDDLEVTRLKNQKIFHP
ncbi:MAG TPA: hypothetical protein VN943_03145 [Candidatus Acidoferrum sp.]|nr:hypothetical protein [Candidatus Acidoferrum sp.]